MLLSDSLCNQASRMHTFIAQNCEGLQVIADRGKHLCQLSSLPKSLMMQLAVSPFANMPFDRLLVLLSDIYHVIRSAKQPPGNKSGTQWVPPSDFSRKTVKYWVRPADILKVCKAPLGFPLLITPCRWLCRITVPSSRPDLPS